ncbi:MAG: DUF4102 domain-containing protein [Synergistaceae bacterium]|nr:DUF4102 domain-containing protein [Synergistaceae bacterium]MBQ4419453.1 DUF4102 domain-containing protein [Synergistaceae bacterium]MBQ6910200.1 DUF4102 domain-containing protein [Synergistaceae bacterium]MBR0096195.1 DUF4102 domain-containing protein [Synergistaceae bacterium]MBR0222384.1 DUF4102 domain-containing protein [Synergistaceae bacterium]
MKHAVLTELKIKNLKPRDKKYMLSDGCGLGLRVDPNGHILFLDLRKIKKSGSSRSAYIPLYHLPTQGLNATNCRIDALKASTCSTREN